jgi:hypothetical protein
MSSENRVFTENVKEASKLLRQVQGVIDELNIDVNFIAENNVKVREFGSEISVSASGPINIASEQPDEKTEELQSVKEAKSLVLQSTSFLEKLGLKPELQIKGEISIKDIGLELSFDHGVCVGCTGGCSGCTGCGGTCEGHCGGCQGAPNTLSQYEMVSQPADLAAFKEEVVADLLEQLRNRS